MHPHNAALLSGTAVLVWAIGVMWLLTTYTTVMLTVLPTTAEAATAALQFTNDQLCVQVHHGKCVDYHQCTPGKTMDVCDSPKEVCCSVSSSDQDGRSKFPTSQIPLYAANCPSTVQSRVGSLWLYAREDPRGAEGTAGGSNVLLYLYPDLGNEYYDCTRYQMVALQERAQLLELAIVAAPLPDGSVLLGSEPPYVRAVRPTYHFARSTRDSTPEDTLFPLLATLPGHSCNDQSAQELLVVATVQARTAYSVHNLTLVGGNTPLFCNASAIPQLQRERCDGLNYYLATHTYREGCEALSSSSGGGAGGGGNDMCERQCTSTAAGGATGLCLDRQQCGDMGALGGDLCEHCSGSASGGEAVCCTFVPGPALSAEATSPGGDGRSPGSTSPYPTPDSPSSGGPLGGENGGNSSGVGDENDPGWFFFNFFLTLACLMFGLVVLTCLRRYLRRRLGYEPAPSTPGSTSAGGPGANANKEGEGEPTVDPSSNAGTHGHTHKDGGDFDNFDDFGDFESLETLEDYSV